MHSTNPLHESTEVADERTWRPVSLQTLYAEAEHLRSAAFGAPQERVLLYRGQRDSAWSLNSTFARDAVNRFDRTEAYYGNRIHQALVDKFGSEVLPPSQELTGVAASHAGIDPLFELMKRIQQHPNEFAEYHGIAGSNLLDWSRSVNVGLAFAAEDPSREGTLYLLDARAAGNVLMTKPVREILDLVEAGLVDGVVHGRPILFCPSQQIAYERATRQDARYVAQMDLRYSLEHVWQACEAERDDGELIYWRLLLSPAVKVDVNAHLDAIGRSAAWLLEPPA